MAETGRPVDPFGNFNFRVEIDGINVAAFHECSGFDSAVDVIEHREGGDSATLRKLPGPARFANIMLKRGLTDDRELYEWHRRIVRGETERKNGSIVLMDRRGQEVARWNFVRAWPSKWTGPQLTAEGNDVAIETLEIVHEGLERV